MGDYLQDTNTKICKFPANATHLLQPADSFVSQILKDSWLRLLDYHGLAVKHEEQFNKKERSEASGKHFNPRKVFHLRLASTVIIEVNNQRDSSGNSYAPNSMMRTGLYLNYDVFCQNTCRAVNCKQ